MEENSKSFADAFFGVHGCPVKAARQRRFFRYLGLMLLLNAGLYLVR